MLEDGPLLVGMDSSDPFLILYKKGTILDLNPKACNYVNHAFVAVGRGWDDKGKEFLIIRNSWGPTWGEDGYFRVYGNPASLTCKIEQQAFLVKAETKSKV